MSERQTRLMSESTPTPPPIDYGSYPVASLPANPADAPKRVGFVEAVSRAFRQYAKFSGRASRSEYWWFSLFLFLSQLGLSLLVVLAQSKAQALGQMAGVLLAVLPIVFLIPGLALTSRRIHDSGRSAKLYFAMLLSMILVIPVLYFAFLIAVFSLSGGMMKVVIVATVAIFGFISIYSLVVTLSPSAPGANRYGPGLE